MKKWVVKLCRQRAKKSVKKGRQQYSMTICGASVKIMIDRASSASLALSLAYKSWQTNTLWSHVHCTINAYSKLNLKWIRAFQISDLIKSLKCRPFATAFPHVHATVEFESHCEIYEILSSLMQSNVVLRQLCYYSPCNNGSILNLIRTQAQGEISRYQY